MCKIFIHTYVHICGYVLVPIYITHICGYVVDIRYIERDGYFSAIDKNIYLLLTQTVVVLIPMFTYVRGLRVRAMYVFIRGRKLTSSHYG
jgi:hypothetical protein